MTEDLTTLLHDAVEDVEPAERLTEIRAAVRSRPDRGGRRWYAAGGAALAVAAVVTAVAVLSQPTDDDVPGPADRPSPSAEDEPGPPVAVPVYYIGEAPSGPRLFRYFEPLRGEPDHGSAAELGLLTSTPSDPDYRTLWPEGAFADASADLDAGLITVTLADSSLRGRPASMSAPEARLAVQQVVYTVQAQAGQRLPVQFRTESNPVDQVFGVPTSEPITADPQAEVLALMSISNPSEGRVVEGSFSADGVAMSFEGNVPWALLDAAGAVVRSGYSTGTFDPDRLTAWATEEIDVSGLPPGSYEFVARTDDPSGGAEGPGPTSDTRSLTIR